MAEQWRAERRGKVGNFSDKINWGRVGGGKRNGGRGMGVKAANRVNRALANRLRGVNREGAGSETAIDQGSRLGKERGPALA
jgi:hypothetical protein